MAVDTARMEEMGGMKKDNETKRRKHGNDIKDACPSGPVEEPPVQPTNSTTKFCSNDETERASVPHSSSRPRHDKPKCLVCGKCH